MIQPMSVYKAPFYRALTPAEKLVLRHIYDSTNGTGIFYGSLRKVWETLGLDRKTVLSAMVRLREVGAFEKVTNQGPGRPILYTLFTEDQSQGLGPVPESGTSPAPSQKQSQGTGLDQSRRLGLNHKLPEISEYSSKRKRIPTPDAVERVYRLYPTTDRNNEGRSTGKSHKDKDRIERILREKKYPLFKAISLYLKHCKAKGEWLKNFGTLLSNLPGSDLIDDWEKRYLSTRFQPVQVIEQTETEEERRQAALEAVSSFLKVGS